MNCQNKGHLSDISDIYRINKGHMDKMNKVNDKKLIYNKKPNTLPYRKALDNIFFDALELNEEERKEVYWAVAELVKNRLEKARSV